jgi:lysozyme
MNEKGEKIVKDSEGCKLKAYLCPARIPTIAWGATRYEDGSKVKLGDTITLERAEKLFKTLINEFETDVKKLIKVEVNENQLSALVSFAYNVGIGNLKNSTLLKKVNAGDFQGASKEFDKWVYSNGKKLAGLIRRRQAEKALFLERGIHG